MKKHILILSILILSRIATLAQEMNWSWDDGVQHYFFLHTGADYGTYYGLSYGYKLSSKIPLAVGIDLSIPFGNNALDDWKLKLSGQTELWQNGYFSLVVKLGFIIRRYKSAAAGLWNIGADISALIGYSGAVWGVAGEINYDRALFTHVKHDFLKEYYPEIHDGWYGATGGNFKFGINGRYTFNSWTLALKGGKLYAQDFKDNPTFPFYFDFGIQKAF